MPNTKQIIIDRTEKYRTDFKDLTVIQIDELKNEFNLPLKPFGKMSCIAWNNARKEIVKKEEQEIKINELKILLPSISDEDLEKISISNDDEDDNIIIKTKEIQEIK